MEKNEENNKEIVIRLTLKPKEDQPLYRFFKRIKKHLGVKVNTEVARYLIKRVYEILFEGDHED